MRSLRALGAVALAFHFVCGHAFAQSLKATDCSTTITTGGTAQNLCSGAAPPNGWTVINPDATEDCWASDTTTAAANNTGSIRLAANGGGYESPPNMKPNGAVSVVCATTGHKLTAKIW